MIGLPGAAAHVIAMPPPSSILNHDGVVGGTTGSISTTLPRALTSRPVVSSPASPEPSADLPLIPTGDTFPEPQCSTEAAEMNLSPLVVAAIVPVTETTVSWRTTVPVGHRSRRAHRLGSGNHGYHHLGGIAQHYPVGGGVEECVIARESGGTGALERPIRVLGSCFRALATHEGGGDRHAHLPHVIRKQTGRGRV